MIDLYNPILVQYLLSTAAAAVPITQIIIEKDNDFMPQSESHVSAMMTFLNSYH